MSAQPRTVNFDVLARPYRWLEYLTFGTGLMRCRCQYLQELRNCRRALVLGDGDGRFLCALLAAAPQLTADVVDSSHAMLHILSDRVAALHATNRVTLHHSDVLAFQPPRTNYDLVVCHFFLDCFDDGEVDILLETVSSSISAGALWVISEFAVPPSTISSSALQKLISHFAGLLIRFLYTIFGLTTGLRVRSLPSYAAAMQAHGLHLKSRSIWLRGLLVSELWTAGYRT